MSFSNGPTVVTNGLVLALDAGDKNSYVSGSTTWIDLAGTNNGTLTNGPTFNTGSGGSIVFDGVDDRVQTSYGPNLGDFTVCVWFKSNSTTDYGRLVDKSYTGGFWLGRQSSTPNSFGGGILEPNSPYGIYLTLPDNQWNFLTSIRSNTTHILYGNGITNTISNTVPSSLLDSTTLAIGAWSGGTYSSQVFNGNIAITQLYNRALSQAEVLQNYNATKGRFGL